MKIGIIGATGKAGKLILKEAVKRGHDVTAVVRNPEKVSDTTAKVIEKDIFNLKTSDIKEFDVVVNAFNAAPGKEHQHVEAGNVLIKALKDAPETKLVVVGGAGSLFVDEKETIKVMETPDFPAEFLPTAINMGENLKELQSTAGIQWTYISPAGFFDAEGKRTGSYQKGNDQLILNSKGESYISYADYAIAVLDEIENPQHENQRFSVVGEAE
ncbi:NAD(P)-dependent oxidoreductase [Priestia megaterium]|uniref:NAD(P)-dependent oxidoreductase n=1 Tax=Priestia megaterium TaxID=1404 RepID=UPI0020412035|nr:NAD(P)-dependent oxidoreductase [Priestia megaterium]MCM3186853.1 NAD(P)-dependent oxidoreductase [Priestia megaterium]